jgi:hypothetical protein
VLEQLFLLQAVGLVEPILGLVVLVAVEVLAEVLQAVADE